MHSNKQRTTSHARIRAGGRFVTHRTTTPFATGLRTRHDERRASSC